MKHSAKRAMLVVLLAILMSFSLEIQVSAEEQGAAVQDLQEIQDEETTSADALVKDAGESGDMVRAEEEVSSESVVTEEAEEEVSSEPVVTKEADEEVSGEPVVTEEADEEISAEPVVTEKAGEEAVAEQEEADVTGLIAEESAVRSASVGAADNTVVLETAEKEPVSATTEEGHNLAFASDLHGESGTLENAMEGFPEDTEYVSIIGDLVGARGGDTPVYYADDVYDRIRGIFESIEKEQVSILWADHDKEAVNQDDLVKCEGGYESGQIYEGRNTDGSTAYYIYGIGFYHMKDGGTTSQTAAEAFKQWVRDKDETIPTLVLCHMPLQAKRGDNLGATYWNEALNFAATGTEGITTDEDTAEIIRNVIYLYGHNHTVDRTEYVFRAGTTMLVQVDAANESGQEQADAASDSGSGKHHRPKAEGALSNIFYNALIPGYLKTSGNASLLNITDDMIRITKYNGGEEVSLGTDGATGEIMPSSLEIERIRWGDPIYVWADDLTSVTASREGVNTSALHQSETVATIAKVTREASGDKDGEITYIAVFDNPAFAEQIRTKVIPATGDKKEEEHSSYDDHSFEETNDRNTVDSASHGGKDHKPVPTGDNDSAALWICLLLAAGIGSVLTKRDLVNRS